MSLYGATFGKSPVPFAPGAARLAGSMPSGGMMREIDQGQLLASIAATSHDCILSLDAEGQVLWASPATHDVLGWRPEDLAGSDLGVLFPRGSGELRTAAMERLLAGERVEPFVEAGVRRDGSTFKAQLTLGPTHGPDGRITGMIAILRDVTEQLQEQRELALALEMSRAHFDQAATPQAIVDLRGHLESVNPAWCELFGHGEGWFADCDLLDLVHPVEAAAVVDRIERLRSGEIDSISYRGLFRGASGRELTLVLDAALLRGPSGRPYAIAASVEDLDSVTETEQTVASDRGAAEERQRFAEVLARRGWDAVVVLDERLAIRHVDRRVARMLGYQPDDLLHHLSWEYLHSAEAGQVAGLLERLVREPHRVETTVLRVRDGDEKWRWVEVTATNRLADPEVAGFVAELRHVTQQARTEEALRISETLHRTMVETAQEGILATSPEGLVLFANETAARIVGRPVTQLYGQDPLRLFGLPESDGVDDVQVHEVAHQRSDGAERILRVALRPLSSRNSRLGSLVSVSDVTEARNVELALRRQALHDPLTSLPNRYLFLDRLETAAARQRRFDGRGTAVLFLDLDDLKPVNDGFGHEAGDALLREVAQRLEVSVRDTDTVGRLGGDEFAVICEDAGLEEALLVARRILESCEEPVAIDGHAHATNLSIGVACSPPYDVGELLGHADAAMYRAKQLGGARIWVAGQDDQGVPAPRSDGQPTS